jgi:hypothetical protein
MRLKVWPPCPYSGIRRLGLIRRVEVKGYEGKKEWGIRKGSIIEGLRIPLTKFLMAIMLFEPDTSVRVAARHLDLAYHTVYSFHALIRSAIPATDTESF